jgi:hypothetical protein
MKTTIKILAFILILATTGCKKTCEPFYEGNKCDQRITTAYNGVFTGITTTSTGTAVSTYSITNGLEPNQIKINNLDATMLGTNNFDIPTQFKTYNGVLYQIFGFGTVTKSTIYFQLTLNGEIAIFSGSK